MRASQYTIPAPCLVSHVACRITGANIGEGRQERGVGLAQLPPIVQATPESAPRGLVDGVPSAVAARYRVFLFREVLVGTVVHDRISQGA